MALACGCESMNTLTPYDAMRIAEDAGISGVIRYNWNKEFIKALNAAFALGAAQEREECAKFLERFSAANNGKVLPLNVMAKNFRARSKA